MTQTKFNSMSARVASGLLVVAASVCTAALFYLLFQYGWTRQRDVASWSGAIATCLVPAVAAVLCIAALRLRPAHRVDFALCACSVAMASYAVEAASTVWFRLPSVVQMEFQRRMARAAAAAGHPFDARSPAEVVRDLRQEGIDAVPSIWARALLTREDGVLQSVVHIDGGSEVLPLAGISGKTTVLCNENGEFLIYKADQHGFNNPPDLWNRGPLDIVAIGDSHVQGYCVPTAQHFITQIRERYPATLNLGIGGDGPLVELATLVEYAAFLQPRRVLWFYCESNDVPSDLFNENESPLLKRYLTPGFRQGIMNRQVDIDRALAEFIEPRLQRTGASRTLVEASTVARNFAPTPTGLFRFLTLGVVRTRLGLKAPSDPSRARLDPAFVESQRANWRPITGLFHQILAEAQTTVASWGGELYFVYLPGRPRYAPTYDMYPLREDILRAASDLNIPIVDLEPTFSAHPDPVALFPFRSADHYNEDGQRLVAQEVLRAISPDGQR